MKPFIFLFAFSLAQMQHCVFASVDSVGGEITHPMGQIALDEIIDRALNEFYTPGMAVAIVHQGKVIHSKGYGLANIENAINATDKTNFRLASVSKAFTAAGLAILVDQGKIKWDDRVKAHLPDFALQDTYATQRFTVKDLLTHQSGLVGGAGDSLIWPEPSGFKRDEVVQRLRYFTPGAPYSAEYAYSNVLYITAGQLIEQVSGISFESFIDNQIFKPLNMQCFSGEMPDEAAQNSAMGYAHNETRGFYPVTRNAITGDALMSAAAGGLVCSASEMAKWLNALLDNAKHNPLATKTIKLPFSIWQLSTMWQSHTLLGVSKEDYEWDGTHFRSYGLGWRLSNLGKYKFVSHTGTLSGYQAYIGLIPEKSLGVIILNNGSNYGARGAVMQSILKAFTHEEQIDWIAKYKTYREKRQKRWIENNKAPVAKADMAIAAQAILGEYNDSWFGQLSIYEEQGAIRIKSLRMKTLVGTISPFENNSFKIDWDNENAQSDAFIHFDVSKDNIIKGAYLRPFSTHQKPNHAYRDMYFTPMTLKASNPCSTVNVSSC
ncbi:MAG: serine hydrolase [Pseudomonadota bacterium]